MKKIYLNFFLAFFGLSLVLTSCDPTDDDNQKNANVEAYFFKEATANLPGSSVSDTYLDIEVAVTSMSSSDRTYNVTVDPSSTAETDEYSIDTSTLFIPAGSFTGTFRVTAHGPNMEIDVPKTIVLNLDAPKVLSSGEQFIVNTFICSSDLAGTYSTVANGGIGDGSGGQSQNYSGLPYTVTLTATASAGVYTVSDMSFGLYPLVYSDTEPSGRISDTCDTIVDLGDTDQYGDPFTINGSVDPVSGVITLSWSNTWGDTGDVVLTPQ